MSVSPRWCESQFRTLTYRPDFPARFGSLEDTHGSAVTSSVGTTTSTVTPASRFHTPADVPTAAPTRSALTAARFSMRPAPHPERFVRHTPIPPARPEGAWINEPEHGPGILT